MRTEPETTSENTDEACKDGSCAKGNCPIGGCGATKGMCPGTGMAIGLIISTIVTSVFSIPQWQMPITFVLAAILIFGFYPTGGRWFRSSSS